MKLMRNPVTAVIHTPECSKGIRASAIPWKYGDPIEDNEGLAKVTFGTALHLCHACLPGVCKCKSCYEEGKDGAISV